MRPAERWLSEYAQSHSNTVNQRIHMVCVPLIFWSLISLCWVAPRPAWMPSPLNWALLLLVAVLAFYFRLGWRYGLSMLGLSAVACALTVALQAAGVPVAWVSVVVFVLAWIGQFYGHKVEGKKPSFLKDIFFLLIGPLWTLHKDENNHP